MSRETALAQINMIERGWAIAVRGVIDAYQNDGRIDLGEGINIGSSSLMFALQMTNILRALTPASAEDMLYVLEHSDRVLPVDPP